MKTKITLLTVCLAAMFSGHALAASNVSVPAGNPAMQRVIVQLKDTLPAAPVDKTDVRIADKKGFGNLKSDVQGHMQRLEQTHGFKAHNGFSHTVKGFSATLTPAQIAKLKQDPSVKLVEVDAPVSAVAQSLPYGIQNSGATASPAAKAGDGVNNATNLSGVQVFVVDTGISTHPDLNLVEFVNYVGDGINSDCNGHGTHVAGTIGAKDDSNYVVGVAPGVKLSALKVLDCTGNGYASNLISAFDYAASVAAANPGTKYVANASVGFPTGTVITSLDTSLQNAVASGLVVAVAAGNTADNTCGTTMVNLSSGPSANSGVLAVGAVDVIGSEASFSSYGSCLAVWAPGVNVLSTYNNGGTATMNGTSMATPHVTGAAAVIRAANPSLTPADVDRAIKANARTLKTLSKDGQAIRHLDITQVGPTGAVAASIVRVDNPVVNFGSVALKAVAKQTVQVTNMGSATLKITGLTGVPSSVTLSSSTCSAVAPGGTCSLVLSLNTTKRVSFSNMLVTTVGANTNASFTVSGTVN